MSTTKISSRPSTVPATETTVPVYSPTIDGATEIIGMLTTREYEGENVRRHFFIPANSPEKEYSIGHTTNAFQFIDHETALRPLLDRGYNIKQAHLFRGGLDAHFILTPEEGTGFAANDPIDWDRELWEGVDDSPLTESLVITTSIRPGRGINYSRGFFRKICTNGLVANVLNLGGARFTHASFREEALVEGLFGPNVRVTDQDITPEKVKGPFVGNRSGAARMAQILRKISEVTTNDEGDEEGEDQEQPIPVRLPLFIDRASTPFQNQPTWYVSSLADQFEAIANFKAEDDVFAIDLLNAVTSPVNLNPDRSARRPLFRVNRLVEASITLIGALSI